MSVNITNHVQNHVRIRLPIIVHFSGESSSIDGYIPNGEWDLDDVIIRYHNKTYGGNVPFSDLTFWLVIRRKTLYYVFNLIVPCACVMVLSFLVFYLPPESGEKVSLSVTSLLSLTFFLTLVAETTPPQSQVIPLIGWCNQQSCFHDL